MDVAAQDDWCKDVGTGKKPSLSHTSNGQFKTTTILTTLLDVATAYTGTTEYGGDFSLTRQTLETTLGKFGGSIGTIGDDFDPVAAVRNPDDFPDTQRAAQRQLAWNAQIISAVDTVRHVIEGQAAKMADVDAFEELKIGPSLRNSAHSPVQQVHAPSVLLAFKAMITTIKTKARRRRLSGDRRLSALSFLSDAETLKQMVVAGITDTQSTLAKLAEVDGTLEAPSTEMLAAVCGKIAAVNALTAAAAKDGTLTITKMNTYNHMSATVNEEVIALTKEGATVQDFEASTDLTFLEAEASAIVEALEEKRQRVRAPTPSPTVDPEQVLNYWDKYIVYFGVFIAMSMLLLIALFVMKKHHGREKEYQHNWYAKRQASHASFRAADTKEEPVGTDDLEGQLENIEPVAAAGGSETVDMHSVDV
jgi:hypothetical protein